MARSGAGETLRASGSRSATELRKASAKPSDTARSPSASTRARTTRHALALAARASSSSSSSSSSSPSSSVLLSGPSGRRRVGAPARRSARRASRR
eukprot:2057727-Rhodomonas_salina.1